MAYKIEAMAGKPYTPSSGSEERAFMARFCHYCIRDTEQSCPILFNALAGTEPPEWTHDERGRPTCTAYKPLTWDDEQRARDLLGDAA